MDVDVVGRTPLKRTNLDVCFYGNKGSGKTIAMTYFAFKKYLEGYRVYSNYNLDFDHTLLRTIHDFTTIQGNGAVLLCDDFESWVSSKFRSNNEKKDMLEASLNFGKRNINYFYWSCKRAMEIDKTLRACVDYFVKCDMVLKDYDGDGDDQYLENYVVSCDVYGGLDLMNVQRIIIDNLELWAELYNTSEEIKKPSVR